jgi:hypothetical protein
MLVHFGLGDDPRVRRAFAFVIADMGRPDALDCSRCAHRECLWGAIAGLNGLADLPDDMRSGESDRIARRLANALLAAPMNKAVGAAAQSRASGRWSGAIGPASGSPSTRCGCCELPGSGQPDGAV